MSGSSGYQSLGYSKDFPMASLQPPSSTSVEQPVPPKDCGLSTGKTTTPEAIHEPYLDDLGDKPPPPGAVEDGKTPNGQTEKATPETSKPGAETWSSPVPLYCTVNGRSHSILTDFGLNICPRCDINLLETPRRGVTDDQAGPAESADGSADESADERDDGLTDKDYNPACNCPHCNGFRLRKRFEHVPLRQQETGEEHNQQPMVAYSVEYIDREEGHIGIRPWPTTFDLDVARQGVLKYKASVFSVVTVLKTSHAPEVFRYISDDLRRDRVSRMMEDPGVTVNVHATKIVVGSQALLKALRMVVRYYPQLDLEGRSLELDEPYAVIGHHLEELESLRGDIGAEKHAPDSIPRVASEPGADDDEDLNAKAGEHLGLLLDYLHANVYKDRIPAERSLHQRNLCTFEMLWLLFKPGTTVYVEFRGNLAAHVVQSVVSDAAILSDPKQRLTPYKIRLWSLTYDGRFVGRSSTEVVLPPFGGERAITSLKVFPCEYFDMSDGGKTKRRLEENGKKWYNLLLGKQVRYRGELFDKGSLEARDSLRMRERIGPNPSKGPNREQLPPPPPPPPWIPPPMDPFMRGASREVTRQGPLDGRVYIDSAAYYTQWPGAAPEICNTNDIGQNLAMCGCEECYGRRPHPPPNFPYASYDLLDPTRVKDLNLGPGDHDPNHRYLLCDSLLYGIVLKSRTWEAFDVARCFEPNINPGAIDTLVMPAPRKQMIKALVQKFTDPKDSLATSWRADFIENKGEGQIFLLHGGPGVGKTYTAECIAEYTNRPLLSLTCGDIGINEIRMEQQLSKWFRLAEKWGAVMLIDEADVYLERRVVSDLERNSLVSVFLRCIEYYRGILFLTTNRVGHFDDAFISRIHVVIKYDPLSEDNRRQIWTQFFDKLTDERQDFIITGRAKQYVLEDDIIKKLEWNGREIRNAFQTAVALAEFRFLQKGDKSKHEGPTLDQKDFEQVCDMTRQFKEYLHDLHGLDEEGRAYNARARAGNQDWVRSTAK